MKKLLLLFNFLFLFIINGNTQSGWSILNPPLTNNTLLSVYFVDANIGYAVGKIGTILKTTDGGNNWLTQISGSTRQLQSVYFIDANKGYVVGYKLILKTTDGGTNWTPQTNVNIYGQLNSIYFINTSTGFIVGNNILKTTDGGANWISQMITTSYLYSVYFTDVNTGYAVGYNGTIFKTTNGGTNWITQTSGTTETLYSVYFTDASTGYIGGSEQYSVFGHPPLILKTTNGGTNWFALTNNSTGDANSIYFINTNIGYIITGDGNALKTTNGGITWNYQEIKNSNGLYSVFFTDINTGYAVGGWDNNNSFGTIHKTTNGGETWYSLSSGTGEQLNSVFSTDLNTVYVAGEPTHHGETIIKTTNGGVTWQPQYYGPPYTYLTSIRFTDNNNGCTGGEVGILKTTNGGASWSPRSFPVEYITSINFSDANTGFALSHGAYQKTTDAGNNWVKRILGTDDLNSVYFPSANIGYIVGSNGLIEKTTNGGTNWVTQTFQTYNELFSVHFPDNNTGYASGDFGTIVKTTNGGTNWTALTSGVNFEIHSIYFTDANIGYFVGQSSNIYKTTDGGTNWFVQASFSDRTFSEVLFLNDNIGYVVGSGGIILKTTSAGEYCVGKAGKPTGASTICQSSGINQYTTSGATDAISYSWKLEPSYAGTITETGLTCTVNWNETFSGNSLITVKGINSCGEGPESDPIIIHIEQYPNSAGIISGYDSVCIGQNDVVYSVPEITNASSYIWTLPNGAVGRSSSNSISVNYGINAVSGNITVKGHNSCGDGNTSTLAITVKSLPNQAGTLSGITDVCQGQNNVTYTVPAITNATSYIWTLPTGTTGTSSTNSITVNYGINAVSGNITVKGHNSCGNGETSTLSITVNPLPIAAGIITGTTAACQGQNNVTYTVPSITNATSYIWTLPTGATGTSTTNSITVDYGMNAVSGDISVKGHNSCGDGIASLLSITVNPVPSTPIITQNFSTLSSNALAGNQWYLNGSMIPGATSQSYTCIVNGNYFDIVTLNGCSSDTSNIINITNVGIEFTENHKTFKIYPNPVNDELIIEISGTTENTNFEILNSIGQLVFKGNLLEMTVVNTSIFSPGVYLIKFENGKTFEFKKMLKD